MEKKKIKIGFIHFDGLHILHHFVGAVSELYKDPDCEVDILTPETNQEYLYYLLSVLKVPNNVVKKLPTFFYKKIAYKIQNRSKPSNQYIFKKHKKMLAKYDILVFNVFTHMHIERVGRDPKFVFLMHGAGDRDYPFLKEFYEPISKFDLITTAGNKIDDLFKTMGDFEFTKFKSCGYQKIDIVTVENKNKQLFKNEKTTVLYNPHFKDHITSYNKFGKDILDFFLNNKDYNLVFAPHINLFDESIKKALQRNTIEDKYFNQSNIIIDFGSVNSVNMAYTMIADVYLGDSSSQVYEFLLKKSKPCVFLNAHSINWKDDKHYQNWHLGKVIENMDNLKEILDTRNTWQKEFEQKQRKAIDYTFDLSDEISSSKRVANAIKALVNK